MRYEQRELSSSSVEKHVCLPLKLVIYVGNTCRRKIRSLLHSGQILWWHPWYGLIPADPASHEKLVFQCRSECVVVCVIEHLLEFIH